MYMTKRRIEEKKITVNFKANESRDSINKA